MLARIHDKNRHLDHRPFHDRARRREPPRAECPLPAGPVTMRAANLIRGSRATVTDCDPNEEREPPSVRQRLLGGGPALARRSGHYVGPKGAMTFDHPNNADERASVLPGQCGVLFGRCIWLVYSPGRRRWKIGSRSAVPWLEGWQRNTRRLSRPTSWVPWLSSARMTAGGCWLWSRGGRSGLASYCHQPQDERSEDQLHCQLHLPARHDDDVRP